MKGDGNCYFRNICSALTGSQRQHNVVRDDIVKWMNENDKLIKHNFGQIYLEESNMELDGELNGSINFINSRILKHGHRYSL
jgi:hypothetical protein